MSWRRVGILTNNFASAALRSGRATFKRGKALSAWQKAPLGLGAVATGVGVSTWAVAYCDAPNVGQASAAAEVDDNALVDINNLQQFDRNWDGRQPLEGDKKPTAVRHIVLIRHGHYNDKAKTDTEAILTLKGRQQSRILAKTLASMPWTPSRVVVSDMTRAQETLDIILKDGLPKGTSTEVIKDLREGRPCQPTPPSKSGVYKQKEVDRTKERVDSAFRALFYRADHAQTEHSYDVVVCHANVIRYMVCKVLQLPTEAWLRMGVPHASLTIIAIYPSGSVSLRCLGNTHNLPPDLITYS